MLAGDFRRLANSMQGEGLVVAIFLWECPTSKKALAKGDSIFQSEDAVADLSFGCGMHFEDIGSH